MSLALRRPPQPETLLTLGTRAFAADASGVLWCEATGTLVVSDLHLEKGSALAARGHLLPPYDTAETLKRLAAAVGRYRPRRVISLGDSFHDGGALTRISAADRAAIGELQRGRDWLWIAGNHDPRLAGLIPGDHAETLVEGGISFVHEPSARLSGLEIAGHLHPCVKIRARARMIRRRAFVTCGNRLVLPAFGAYAGGLNVCEPALASLFPRGFSAFALGEDRTYAIPHDHCWPD